MSEILFRRESPLQRHQRQIEDILKALELEPEDHRLATENPNLLLWSIVRGSTHAEISMRWDRRKQEGWFCVTAPLVHLPELDLLGFYRRLLDLNAEIEGAALHTRQDLVYLRSARPLQGMDTLEAGDVLERVTWNAESLKQRLASEFPVRPADG